MKVQTTITMTTMDVEDFSETMFRAYPWWGSTNYADGVLTVEAVDPDTLEHDKTVKIDADTLGKAYSATLAMYPNVLCCHDDMTTEGIGYACAQDADALIQMAAFGDLVYS